jgi:hypothetical protein
MSIKKMRVYATLIISFMMMANANAINQITFCMVTSERPVSYLEKVLDTFNEQRVNEMDGVGLIVVNMDRTNKGAGIIYPLTRKLAVCDTPDVEGIPICKVRQGTLDVTESLLYCSNFTSGWVVLAEDDCEACNGSIQEIMHTISTLDAVNVSLAKLAKIATGVAFPKDKVSLYAAHAQAHVYDRPHDFYSEREWDPSGSGIYFHKRNLFHHIGSVSTISYRNEESYHKQYDAMREDYCGESIQKKHNISSFKA